MRTELLRDNRPSGQVKPRKKNQPLGGLTHPEQVGQPKRRTVPWTQGLSRPNPSMSAFVTARLYPGVSVYRRARARDLSGSMFLSGPPRLCRTDSDGLSRGGFFGSCLTNLRREIT